MSRSASCGVAGPDRVVDGAVLVQVGLPVAVDVQDLQLLPDVHDGDGLDHLGQRRVPGRLRQGAVEVHVDLGELGMVAGCDQLGRRGEIPAHLLQCGLVADPCGQRGDRWLDQGAGLEQLDQAVG